MTHPFDPVIFKTSRTLILGSFPGPKAIANGFYYTAPTNQLWPILAAVFNDEVHDKRKFLADRALAMADAIAACERRGNSSKDEDLTVLKWLDLAALLQQHPQIKQIVCTSRYVEKTARKQLKTAAIDTPIVYLPSPSMRFAKMGLAQKTAVWGRFLKSGEKLQTLRSHLQAGEESPLLENFDGKGFLVALRKKHHSS
ncbi:MAG: uracil-DNA glycosylase family protein [Campylobacterales bacterium]